MHTQVYANGLEIACKAVGADGVSQAAFPDSCWSPPAPAAGPVVLPYPNTCQASATTNGTATVLICGTEVAIEDHSYFSTSTGNEGATQAFSKGVATGVITGKAYFVQWSFDVIFESYGVPRHTDLVTHNHGSMPSNTPTFPYIARGSWGNACKDEKKRIDRACEKESEQSDSRKAIGKKSKTSALLRAKRKPKNAGGKWHWTDDHCDGLGLSINSYEKAKEYANDMQEAYKQLPEMLNVMDALKSELTDMATKAGVKALGKWAAKAGIKQAAGSSLPVIGNTVMAIWSVVDGAMAIGDVSEIRTVAQESLGKLEMLQAKTADLNSLSSRFSNIQNLTDADVLKLVTEGQDFMATVNDCLRARKCNLVPKSQKDGSRNVETADNGGCCKGQTGHHLIYGAMMDGVDCPGYKYETAPTVCTEGFSQNHGSHGRVHDQMDQEVLSYVKGRKSPGGTMTMKQAIDAAVNSHSQAFPLSRCSKKCIRAQLESYYNCPGAKPKTVNKNGNPHVPDGGSND